MKILKRIFSSILILIILTVTVFGLLMWSNSTVATKQYSVYSKKISTVFSDFKIVLLSDFHNSTNYKQIISATAKAAPKIIVIVGDLINMNDTNYDNVSFLLDGLTPISPVYFVSGNHETWSENEKDFLSFIEYKGVKVLNDDVETITYKNNNINLIGFKDLTYSDEDIRYSYLDKKLQEVNDKIPNKNLFNILLFHRANLFETTTKFDFDLVLSGHTHGGQVNIPYVKQEILKSRYGTDKYSDGYYRNNDSQMIVSAGLEKNFSQMRILNRPQIVVVSLKAI